jgi:ribosome-binding protein aMBF1 (putative translation factor)
MKDREDPVFLFCRRCPGHHRRIGRRGYRRPRPAESTGIDVHIGRRLRILRTESGLSREMLAQGVGLTTDQVDAHERGTARMAARHLVGYATFLGVRLSAFFK